MNTDYIQHTMHPQWTTVISHDDHDHDEDEYEHDEDGRLLAEQDKVRRRSSKACDQCRKNKCKCERTGAINDPCRNCVLLNTECTFLGPSRKRGPPKGYIDAIENRLHQTEALIGALVNSTDPRAVSLLRDVAVDSSAREIIERVTLSPYGSKARKKKDPGHGEPTHSRGKAGEIYTGRLQPFDRPISEWQDMIGKRIGDAATTRLAQGVSLVDAPELDGMSMRDAIRRRTGTYNPSTSSQAQRSRSQQGRIQTKPSATSLKSGVESDDSAQSPIASDDDDLTPGFGQLSLNEHEQFRYHGKVSGLHILGRHRRADRRNEGGIWRFPAPNVYVGQADPMTSIPAAALGLQISPQPHPAILDKSHLMRLELERDIRKTLPPRDIQEHLLELFWIYVHPVLPVLDRQAVMEAWKAETGATEVQGVVDDMIAVGDSPPQQSDTQSRGEKSPSPHIDGTESSTNTHSSNQASIPMQTSATSSNLGVPSANASSNFHSHYQNGTSNSSVHPQARVPLLLLLSIFSISARFSTRSPPVPPDPSQTWDAGDSAVADRYLAAARTLLNHTYSSSRPSTCQALLLLSYREIGVGAMAAAWLYTGMAVRMAQDLGMHRKAERWIWKTVDGGRGVFTERERQVRKKIWYGCVIMDKYVSTYIGRPLSIFDRDFDTPFPNENELEETEMWTADSSDPVLDDEGLHSSGIRPPVRSHVLSCFNQSAKLAGLLSEIVLGIYSVHSPPAPSSRHAEYVKLEEKLDKWLLELPLHLSLDKFQHQHQQVVNSRLKKEPGTAPSIPHPHGGEICASCAPPPPHVFTLHMHYWCTILLLHRPFIRVRSTTPPQTGSPVTIESVLQHGSEKPFDLCMAAASHITSIVSLFAEHHCLLRCPAFFTYYIFSAGIMYVTALMIQPDHPQAGLGLQKCMDTLKRMDRTWSSAGRQWELLQGSQLDLREAELARLQHGAQRNKRAAGDDFERRQFHSPTGHGNRQNSNAQPSRLITNFVVPSSEFDAQPSSSVNVNGTDTMSATSPAYQTQPPRPYNLGLDYVGQSPSTPFNPTLYPNQRSLFPQFERWFTPDPQSRDYQSVPQASQYANGSQMDTTAMATQMPRLPVSSARMPSYWSDFEEPSLLGSSLYSLPIMPGSTQPSNMQTGAQPLYSEAEFSSFS